MQFPKTLGLAEGDTATLHSRVNTPTVMPVTENPWNLQGYLAARVQMSSANVTRMDDSASRFSSGPAIVLYLAAAVLVLQLATANRYGYFGDEMYHMACGEHMAWGYVDQPPLIAVFAWLTRHLFGTSLFAIRLFPAMASFVLVWLTGVLARELGGGRFAQALAALCSACAGVYLILGHLFTMNVFEPLLWMGCAYVVIRIVKTGDQRLWLWFGMLAGIGIENKYSMAVFGFAIVVGLVLTPERKAFKSPWIWIAAVIAFLIFLPNLLWNVQHHFPFLELMRNIRASGRDLAFTPLGYIKAQVFLMTPVTFPVWLLGALYFIFWKTGKPFRVLGWAFVTVLVVFIVLHGKDYYSAPVYPMVFAGRSHCGGATLAPPGDALAGSGPGGADCGRHGGAYAAVFACPVSRGISALPGEVAVPDSARREEHAAGAYAALLLGLLRLERHGARSGQGVCERASGRARGHRDFRS